MNYPITVKLQTENVSADEMKRALATLARSPGLRRIGESTFEVDELPDDPPNCALFVTRYADAIDDPPGPTRQHRQPCFVFARPDRKDAPDSSPSAPGAIPAAEGDSLP
jgi:hypothetical protein